MSTAVTGNGDVASYASARGIDEVLHFTTDRGLIGTFATGAVLSRDLLDEDKYIEHIYTPNCSDRLKDADWTGFVNLSLSRVNRRMLDTSQSWHATEDVWWAVLAFDPAILTHPDVFFTTTNNTYSNCVQRGIGVTGLSLLFAPSVEWGHYGSRCRRQSTTPTSWTTDPQAEVLYPQRLSLEWVRAVYVHEPEHLDDVHTWLRLLRTGDASRVLVAHKPEVFQ